MLAAGAVGSVLGARAIAHSQSRQSGQDFAANATAITSTFRLSVQHEEDLVVAAGAFFAQNPGATQAEFEHWTGAVQAFNRYPELVGIAHLAMVPASQLPSFAAQETTDPAGPLSVDGAFEVTPPGPRPYYCLATVSQSRTGLGTTPAGFDYCATGLGAPLLRARDSGQAAYLPYGSGSGTELVLGAPIYRTGVTPDSLEGRRAAFLGWTGTAVQPGVISATAIDHHPSTAISVRYTGGSSTVALKEGSVPPGAHRASTDLQNGWHVVVYGLVKGNEILDNGYAVALLFGGIAFSVVLASLLFLLGTSRCWALSLVRERTEQLHHQAFHDALTGLPNRALILDRMEQLLARSKRERTPVAALFLDLDNFKDINDTLGHDAGDRLLEGVAERLTGVLREEDTVGRLGGDEFIVLVSGPALAAGADATANRLLRAFQVPFQVPGGMTLAVTASIGVAVAEGIAPDELVRNADIALYRAKSEGRNRAVLFSPSMRRAVEDHRDLDVDLHRAVKASQFFLVYQPVVDLRSGTVTGVEALLRWRHPERGVVGPDEFVGELESNGLIVPVGTWVLGEACRQAVDWERRGYRLNMSVNVAAAQLERDAIVGEVRSALRATGLDPRLLTLELTESTLLKKVALSVRRLELLKATGVRIAIDDFGTGYSSMAYLQDLPIDILKIDRSFVSHITESEESATLVRTLVRLGKTLGLSITAEGVETEGQRARLGTEGADSGQGYFFSRPIEPEVLTGLLDEGWKPGQMLAVAS